MLGKGLESLIPKKQNIQSSQDQQINPMKESSVLVEKNVSEAERAGFPAAEGASEERGRESSGVSHAGRNDRDFSKTKQMVKEAIFQIETEKIKSNPLQPRRDFDEESLKELAASIQEFGILQPILVSKIEKDTDTGTEVEYQLIAGERRLKAAKILGWQRVPVIIKKTPQKLDQFEIAITENLQRSDLSPIETARAYAKLQDEFNMTQREIAQRLGKSRETVANTLRLLNLPSEIQDALSQNRINESQARLLMMVEDLNQQQNLFKQLIDNNLSVRELRQRVKKSGNSQEEAGAKKQIVIDPEIADFQDKLAELLGAQVNINPPAGSEKAGKITITFYSPEEIKGIIEKLSPNEKTEQ